MCRDEFSVDVAEYVRRPVIGSITTDGGNRALHVRNATDSDTRDGESLYAATSSDRDNAVAFLFDPVPGHGGVVLQVRAELSHLATGP